MINILEEEKHSAVIIIRILSLQEQTYSQNKMENRKTRLAIQCTCITISLNPLLHFEGVKAKEY